MKKKKKFENNVRFPDFQIIRHKKEIDRKCTRIPKIFQNHNIHVDDLIRLLKSAGVGCQIASRFASALFHADDMVVLAPSSKRLSKGF